MSRSPSQKPNYWVLAIGFALIVPVLAILGSGFGNDPRAVPSMMESKPAPNFDLVQLDGTRTTLEELRGKPVILNFWSTWCQPCKIEHALLQQAQRDQQDVQFLGILYSDKPEIAARYLDKVGAAYPTLVDEGNRVAIDYGVAGVPETFFITKSGDIAAKWTGPISWPTLQSNIALIRKQ
jgi:cytochrome c biogenesis protein CcmG/thiol:disulfide interchange protein DsbE